MNALLSGAILFLVVGVSMADWENGKKPKFCKKYDCPEYDVLETNGDYELRRYKSAKWVSHSDSGSSSSNMRRKMGNSFWKLFGYIMMRNDKSMYIPMTCPVTTRISLCTDDSCKPSYERSFYIPPAHQSDAPNPSDSSVVVQEWSEMTVFVKSFGGWASQDDYVEQVEKLAAAINDPTRFDNTQYYQVGYDSPMTWWNRHNEVWLLAN